MEPANFEQANTNFGPPPGMSEGQVRTIPGCRAIVKGGSCDGMPICVVAWKPTPADLLRLQNGGVVYLSVYGGLPPHLLTTVWEHIGITEPKIKNVTEEPGN